LADHQAGRRQAKLETLGDVADAQLSLERAGQQHWSVARTERGRLERFLEGRRWWAAALECPEHRTHVPDQRAEIALDVLGDCGFPLARASGCGCGCGLDRHLLRATVFKSF